MFKHLLYITTFSFLLLSSVTFAQNAPKFSNEFLGIGVGARALAMGNSQVALANDATAGYWNPAGLTELSQTYDLALMHTEHFAGIAQYDFIGFATPIDEQSYFGATVIRFGVDDIPDTRFLYDASGRLDYNNIRFFSAADYAFLLSYARKTNFLGNLRWGANFKVIYRNAGDFANAWGIGLDAGLKWDYKTWHFGLVARDITGTFNAWTHNTELVYETFIQTGNEIPQNSIEITLPRLVLGIAKDFQFHPKFGSTISADFISTFDGKRNTVLKTSILSIEPVTGVELNYNQMVFLRGGVNNIQQIKNLDGNGSSWSFQPNFGLGIKLKSFTIDYALTDVGDQSAALFSHVFSLKISFDAL